MGLMKKLFARLTPEQVAARGEKMIHVHEWNCGCGAKLKIRSRDPRGPEESNFQLFPEGHIYEGHSILPAHLLNWKGLAEERGWQVSPVQCPACQRGMTMKQYKAHKALGGQ